MINKDTLNLEFTLNTGQDGSIPGMCSFTLTKTRLAVKSAAGLSETPQSVEGIKYSMWDGNDLGFGTGEVAREKDIRDYEFIIHGF